MRKSCNLLIEYCSIRLLISRWDRYLGDIFFDVLKRSTQENNKLTRFDQYESLYKFLDENIY